MTSKAIRTPLASPLLIGTDEEGGTVVRASSNPDLFPQREPAPQTLFAQGGMDLILQDARQKSMTLLDLGGQCQLRPGRRRLH